MSSFNSASTMVDYADEAGASEEERGKGTRKLAVDCIYRSLNFRFAMDHYIRAHGYLQEAMSFIEELHDIEELPTTSDSISFILTLANKHVESERTMNEIKSKLDKAEYEIEQGNERYSNSTSDLKRISDIEEQIPWLRENIRS